MSGGMPPADAIVTLLSSLHARLASAPAASALTSSRPPPTSAMSGGMPPADAIVTILSSFRARLASAHAACALTSSGPPPISAMSGGIAPADAIVARLSSFRARFASARAARTLTRGLRSSAMSGKIAPADTFQPLITRSASARTALSVFLKELPLNSVVSDGMPRIASCVSACSAWFLTSSESALSSAVSGGIAPNDTILA